MVMANRSSREIAAKGLLQVLERLAGEPDRADLTLDRLRAELEGRGFGFFILLLCLPRAVPGLYGAPAGVERPLLAN